MKKLGIMLVLCLALPIAGFAATSSSNVTTCPVKTITFDDGDSIACGDEMIRVLGVDTPEVKHEAHGIYKDQAYGPEASAFTNGLLKQAKKVQLVRAGKDKYGRILAHVLIDGKLLGAQLIKAGLAYETISHYGDNGLPMYAKQIMSAAAKAPQPKFEQPYLWRKKNQRKK